ncbi:MAG: ATP-dependent helicase [Candidatus Omnitrophica bacterium]|nr:ATP-dependent helicase [Candidatus Omnitrophota bacterium]
MDYLQSLNERQRAAVVFDQGNLIITAGPGTGKTHTLTCRIKTLIPKLLSNQKILAVTFTNKAAQEMRTRLKELDVDIERSVEVGTFHAFALALLRRYKDQLAFPLDFNIASPDEILILSKELWSGRSKSERRKTLKEISDKKSCLANAPDTADSLALSRFMRERKLVDFDDILRDSVILLRDNAEVLSNVRAAYRFILVDEYQDINAIQEELLRLLAQGGAGLTVIGDPNQAIYSFRGSDVSFFGSFAKNFPPAQELSLSENYRSSENLLTASAQVISAREKIPLSPLTARIYEQGFLNVHGAASVKAEAEYVVRSIEKLVGGTSMFSHDTKRASSHKGSEYSFGDIAVLYRLNRQSGALKEALVRSGIPFQVSGDKAPTLALESRVFLRSLPDNTDLNTALLSLKAKDPLLEENWEKVLAQASSSSSVADFCDKISLTTSDDAFSFKVEKVSLMTLHAAKGLEFSVVFIIGCNEGLIPLALEGFASDIEEERRLFYVGMTRAKRVLTLTHAPFNGLGKNHASPFLSDIEEALKSYEALAARKPRRKNPDADQLKLF